MVTRLNEDTTFVTFYFDFLLKNKPAIFESALTTNWQCMRDWVLSDGKPNLDFLREHFGRSFTLLFIQQIFENELHVQVFFFKRNF